jgi:hypothetical protein
MNTTEVLALTNSAAGAAVGAVVASGQFPEHFGLVLLAGFCGGLCRALAEPEPFWPHAVGTVLTGLFVAAFLWPAGAPMAEPLIGRLDLAPPSEAMFGGFLAGLMGVTLVGIILDFARARRKRLEEDLEK